MRFFEIVKPIKVVLPKPPYDPDPDAEKQARLRSAIVKARANTQRAAQEYSDRREADDEAEREAQRTLAGR